MGLTESLDVSLKAADAEVRDFVEALKSEIRKLQKQNIKLQAQHISDQERISALEDELKELQSRPMVVVQQFTPPDKEKK
jgi:predicted  nucleic acid-binding Zn-ribbon protein